MLPSSAINFSTSTPATKSRVVSARELMAEPIEPEVVEDIAAPGCVTVLVSESGAGKTFVAIDIAAAVSAGLPWHSRLTLEGTVVYLTWEGTLGRRFRAAHDVRGHRLDNVYVIGCHEPISPRLGRDGSEDRSLAELALISDIEQLRLHLEADGRPPVRLIVFDTARASMAGSEDASDSVAAYIRAVRHVIGAARGAAALVIHHAGWQDGEQRRKRERGSSAWRGNSDYTLFLERNGEYDDQRGEQTLVIRVLKSRDGEEGAPLRLIRRRVDLLASNRRGEPVTSCVIESDRTSREDREAATAAKLQAANAVIDATVLRAIIDRPESATSADRIRLLVNRRKSDVTESLARLMRMDHVRPGRRGQAYLVTNLGRATLAEVRP